MGRNSDDEWADWRECAPEHDTYGPSELFFDMIYDHVPDEPAFEAFQEEDSHDIDGALGGGANAYAAKRKETDAAREENLRQARESVVELCRIGDFQGLQDTFSGTGADFAHASLHADGRALFAAAKGGHHLCLQLLLEKCDTWLRPGNNGMLGVRDENGRTAAHVAALHEHSLCVKLLVQRGAVHEAAQKGDLDALRVMVQTLPPSEIGLLSGHSNPQHMSLQMATPLHSAATFDRVECVRYLISLGLDVNNTFHPLGNTPAHVAAQYGSLNCLKCLHIEGGADLSILNRACHSVLMNARLYVGGCQSGCAKYVEPVEAYMHQRVSWVDRQNRMMADWRKRVYPIAE